MSFESGYKLFLYILADPNSVLKNNKRLLCKGPISYGSKIVRYIRVCVCVLPRARYTKHYVCSAFCNV